MKRTILIYGISLALLVFLLEYVEYKVRIRDLSAEFYITVLALLFTALGIWVGRTLNARSRISFTKNTQALVYLGISERELEVLELVAQGLSNQQIADRLFVSINTVKTHLSRLYEKLEVKRRTEAVKKARVLQLIK